MQKNTLYYGDNLQILREYIKDESVDLVYLDPPFNSNRTYNVLFKEESGQASEAQMTAFEDTWHWNIETERIYNELVTDGNPQVANMIAALRQFIGTNQMMAYLVMMTVRLVELHRVLKPTGSIYLHCDPTASHYLKIVLDTIFGIENFQNEIVWKRTNAKGLAFTRFASNHDVILRYSKTNEWIWNSQYKEHDPEYIRKFYRFVEEESGRRYMLDNLANPNKDRPNLTYEFLGVTRVWRWTKERMQKAYEDGLIVQSKEGTVPRYKRYLDEQEGTPIDDVWADINPVQAGTAERLGYPTQKPQELLERIVDASSNPGDVVLDPFCGCGTAIAAAQALGRKWIGIDVTHLAITLIKYRLEDSFPGIEFEILGEPKTVSAAHYLAERDRHQFEWWACSLVRARPSGATASSRQGKKGADRGVDGSINFIDDASGKPKSVIVQVKSGKVHSTYVRDLVGTLEREKAPIGVLITLEEPTKAMLKEAAEAGFYESKLWAQQYPRVQIFTIEQLLSGAKVQMPPQHGTFKQAERQKSKDQPEQLDLL